METTIKNIPCAVVTLEKEPTAELVNTRKKLSIKEVQIAMLEQEIWFQRVLLIILIPAFVLLLAKVL